MQNQTNVDGASIQSIVTLPTTVLVSARQVLVDDEYLVLWYEKNVQYPFYPRKGDRLELNGFIDPCTVNFLCYCEWEGYAGISIEAEINEEVPASEYRQEAWARMHARAIESGWKLTNFDGPDEWKSLFGWST